MANARGITALPTFSGNPDRTTRGLRLVDVVKQQRTKFTEEYYGAYALLGRLLDPALGAAPVDQAAEASCDALEAFLTATGLATTLRQLGVPAGELGALAKQSLVLPDYKGHPRVASLEDVTGILEDSYAG